jgi:hypothetical protein
MLRRCLMYANIPMCLFFGARARPLPSSLGPLVQPAARHVKSRSIAPCARQHPSVQQRTRHGRRPDTPGALPFAAALVLMGQSEFHQMGMSCKQQGFLAQV